MSLQLPTLFVPGDAFNPVYLPYLQAHQRTQLFYGGAGSGKSVFLASRALLDCLCGRNTLVVRQVARTLRTSCFAEVQKCAARFGLSGFFRVNKTEMAITCLKNGAQLLFLGLDDAEKIKSITPQKGVLTDIWVEEATETARADIRQLEKRLRGRSPHKKRLTLSFNPVSRGHWIFQEYFSGFDEAARRMEGEDLLILRTTYRDNRFLAKDDILALENERDPYFHQVYTQGDWGALGGSVLTSWRQGEAPFNLPNTWLRCGLDFGFAQDPAACLLLAYDKKHRLIYALGEVYERGLTNDVLAQKVKALVGAQPVICDAAEPKSILELRRHGVYALAAKKGPDSVLHGLQWLNQQELVVSSNCPRLLEELLGYRWAPDARGRALPRPQGEDHLLDALRYAMEGDSLAKAAWALPR